MTEFRNILKIRAYVQQLRRNLYDRRDANLDELIVYIDQILRAYDNTEINTP